MGLRILDATGYTGDKSQWAALQKASYLFGSTILSTPSEITVITNAAKLLNTQVYAGDYEDSTIDLRDDDGVVDTDRIPAVTSNIANYNRIVKQVKLETSRKVGVFGWPFSPLPAVLSSIDDTLVFAPNFTQANDYVASRLQVDISSPQWYMQDTPSADYNTAFFNMMWASNLTCGVYAPGKEVIPWFRLEIALGGSGTPEDALPLSSVQTIVWGAANLGIKNLVVFAGNTKAFSAVPSDIRAFIAGYA